MAINVMVVAGARPNFMKIAPLMRALAQHPDLFEVCLVHTGQHYDVDMSEVFFRDLEIPTPDINLNVGSDTQAAQTARIMVEFERVILSEQPQLVIVVGDVNSTLACSLVASKLGIKVAHIEAGLRSFDRRMPEEINRVVTDALSDFLFVSEPSGLQHLQHAADCPGEIFLVGNLMIDTLLSHLPRIHQSEILKALGLTRDRYAVVTLHRPSNVDTREALEEIRSLLADVAYHCPLIYPVHPRARAQMRSYGLLEAFEQMRGLTMIEPLGYIDFIKLVANARFVMTDSGGLQEETTVLKIPCLTMRENTERPITITQGTNALIGWDRAKLLEAVETILAGQWKAGGIPSYWDGQAAFRVVQILRERLLASSLPRYEVGHGTLREVELS
ncbi:MAG: UDP-N-acetylglucosamine 2-epimerase (non-hydrolyzing) [Candidatus Omnitrophica bacterium]|nr:UDP-N-acetylglucosamine 2-epimerase (non-hydrolyzing) [Candidatus Omnitrophota bacterium]